MAFVVIMLGTFAIIMQFKVLHDLGVTTSSQMFIIFSTAIMQMAAIIIIVLQKTRSRLEEVKNLAYADELTGLVNRRKFYELLNDSIEKHRNQNAKLGMLILDLDGFKMINDIHGHDAGDQAIRQFGKRLQKVAPSSSIICRISGDEFAIMLKNISSKDHIFEVCNDILREMEEPFKYEGKKINSSVSIGAAVVDGFEDEYLSPFRMADFALLESKNNGRKQAKLFDDEMAAKIKRRTNLEAGMSKAISSETLTLKYQPFVLPKDNSISGVEALVRWDHPVEGEVLPSEFLPVAQELGLLEEIGSFILERACLEVKPFNDIRLAVNINSAQFMQNGFVEQVEDILEKTGFEPSRLELELSQNLLVSTSEEIKSDLQALRKLGVRIVLDNFGTSYSSMFFLREFKLDRIKLDRNFVTRMRDEKDGKEIIHNMIGLSSTFSDRLTVEGIENEDQLEMMKKHEIDNMQGFLFSKPLTIQELENSKMVIELKQRTKTDNVNSNPKSIPINRIAS